jgi:AraC-like DNA-binding protein
LDNSYVALNTLCKVVNKDTEAIQRHRNTVVECLKDADISIRRRALDLIYALVTKSNVRALVKELLNYLALTSGDVEFKSDLTDKICLVADRYHISASSLHHLISPMSTLCCCRWIDMHQVSDGTLIQ